MKKPAMGRLFLAISVRASLGATISEPVGRKRPLTVVVRRELLLKRSAASDLLQGDYDFLVQVAKVEFGLDLFRLDAFGEKRRQFFAPQVHCVGLQP